METLKSHDSHTLSLRNGKIEETTCRCTGPKNAYTDKNAPPPNDKKTKSSGANYYDIDVEKGHITLALDTERDAWTPKEHNANRACILYHFLDLIPSDSRDEHGAHAADEVDTESYGRNETPKFNPTLVDFLRKEYPLDRATCTPRCDRNYVSTTTRLSGNELGGHKR